MLHSTSLVAFVATAQAEAARHFYESVLGLSLVEDSPFALVFDSNGTTLRVQKVEQVTPAPYTALGWQVTDIEASVRSLRATRVCPKMLWEFGSHQAGPRSPGSVIPTATHCLSRSRRHET